VGVVLLEVGDNLDVGAEKVRLAKEIEKIEKAVAAGEAKLSNETFVSKAPPQILEGARKQLTEAQTKRDELVRMLASLG
jgi:valyl-tRNA synthetase